MRQITIVREADELNKEEWDFYFFDDKCQLVLDGYRQMARQTKRHNFNVMDSYRRLDSRGAAISVTEVPLHLDVIAQAKQEFCNRITVVRKRT